MAQIGHLDKMDINITKPIEMDIKDLTLNSIALFVGQNGSGKTLVLKMIWLCAQIANINGKMGGVKGFDPEKAATELFNGSFDDNDFTGEINAKFKKGNVDLTLDDGEVMSLTVQLDADVDQFGMAVFMSKSMRTFDQIDQYLKFRQMIGVHGLIEPKDARALEQIQTMYKIYDIMYCEALIAKTINGLDVPSNILTALHGFEGMEKYDIKHIKYDYPSNNLLWFDDDGVEHKFTRMSAGEQSLCNMVLAQGLF